FGVAVLNGIVLIAEFNRLKNNGMKNLYLIVLTGTKLRLRPVLMTAFVASLGFLPMAISNGAGAEVQRPLATVVIGGLLVATFLTLYVLPLLYILFEKGVRISAITTRKLAIVSSLFLLVLNGFAQQKISLDSAIKIAMQNNNQIKNEQLKSAYAKALIKTATEIPKTNVVAEYGQINSAYSDTKFGIAQSIAFPTVYKMQKKLVTEEYNAALLGITLKEHEIKKAVTQVFYNVVYLKEKKKLLLLADTLYNNFYTKANLRLQKGESNILEKTTAETQRANIVLQLRQVQQAIETTILELQLLLNTTQIFEPVVANYKMLNVVLADTTSIANNPLLKIIQQQKAIAQAQTSVEKSKLLPDFSLGYFNNSFKGTGADNKLYTGSKRFNSVQLGIGIPIFAKAQKARLAAAKLQEGILQSQYQSNLINLQNQYKQIFTTYQNNVEAVKYFEESGLKNASLITQTANKQFINGEINYLDFVMLTNQAIAIQSNYIEAVNALNESIIAINFITSK
ncbi:MAG: efflux RND transporter permease subunit, partial [Ferruginibacter sp.]|nr:efflux RND transporter permease subunit [Ferruginibacter sp.]